MSADKPQALVRRLADLEWEGWPPAEAAERGAGGAAVAGRQRQAIAVEAGTAIYIPGDAEHQIENIEAEDLLILYTFAVKHWSEVQYRFTPEKRLA